MSKFNADINSAGDCWIQVTISGETANTLTEAQIASSLSTLPIAGAGKVKPLEWSSVGNSHKGDGAIVCYYVDLFGGEFTLSYPPMRGKRQESYGTLDAAKVAAQTDYEALILSALISSPGKDGGQEPVLFVSEQQLPACIGTYLPTRKNREGNFQMPLYASPQPAITALVERLDPIGYIGQSSADMLCSGEISGAALSREPTKSSTVPVFTECMKQVEAETWAALCKLTFAVQHNPNCPSPWLVRLAGKGPIDMKPYGDVLGIVPHQTGDILGFGKTFTEAARSALSASQSTSREGER